MCLSLFPHRYVYSRSFYFIVMFLAWTLGVQGSVTRLGFRPIDAGYSPSLNKLITISAGPDTLHIFDVASGFDHPVSLSGAPSNLSVSPDGKHAAVAHAGFVSYVNLETATVERVFRDGALQPAQLVVGNAYIYSFPLPPSFESVSIDIVSGKVNVATPTLLTSGIYDPLTNVIYTGGYGNPGEVSNYLANGPTLTSQNTRPFSYFFSFDVCSPLFLSQDDSRIYTSCGSVFKTSADLDRDSRYMGTLGKSYFVQSLADGGSSKRVAAIERIPPFPDPNKVNLDAGVDLFDVQSLDLIGHLSTTPFTVGGRDYAAHGRYVFFNAKGSSLVLLTQADPAAGLLQDFAVEVIDLSQTNSCKAQFGSTSASVAWAGSYITAPILSGEDCVFTAESSVPWLVPTSGYYGSGDTALTLLVRPNLGSAARSGTISLGSETFTVTQDAMPASLPSATFLSFKPVAADYDKALDRLILVSSTPNEVHIYDPVSRADGIIPLSYKPLGVSVQPDGLLAAVSHSGHVTVVDLKGQKIKQVFDVDKNNGGILLASNGYVYTFPAPSYAYDNSLDSVRLSDGTVTLANLPLLGYQARLHPSGTYAYVGGSEETTRLDLNGGPAVVLNNYSSLNGSGGNIWLSEDGKRLFDVTGAAFLTSPLPSQDLQFDGSLSGVSLVSWIANSQARAETAAMADSAVKQDTTVQIYADNGLQLQREVEISGSTDPMHPYASHGRYLFWNADASKLFAVTQMDDASGLLSPFVLSQFDSPQSLPACSFALSPMELWVPAQSSSDWQVDVASNCSWRVSYDQSAGFWIYSDYNDVTTGNAKVSFSPSTNGGPARSEALYIGDKQVIVHQEASTCSYLVSTGQLYFTQEGGTADVTLTTGSDCHWTVQSNVPWLAIANAQTGIGSATIRLAVAPNTPSGQSRSTNANVAGQAIFVLQTAATVSPALNFVPVAPCRVVDTRLTNGPFGGPFLAGGTSRTFLVTQSDCNIPPSAAAYSLNIAAAPHGSLGYLTAWPSGQLQPFVSTLNSFDGRIKANAALIGAGLNSGVSVYATNDTDVVIDTNGYFVSADSGQGLTYYPTTPCRVLDTREAAGPLGGPNLAGGSIRELAVNEASCELPETAGAFSLNFAAIPSNEGLGYLTTWPTGQKQPFVATLNALNGQVTANAAIVPTGTSGHIDVFATNPTDLVIDSNGYFATPNSRGLHFYSVAPCRVFDTRTAIGGEPFQGVLNIPISGYCDVPVSAEAVVLNATVVPARTLGYLTLWPPWRPQPFVSTLNSFDGAVTSNMAIVALGYGGIDAFATDLTHLVLDVTGYFAP